MQKHHRPAAAVRQEVPGSSPKITHARVPHAIGSDPELGLVEKVLVMALVRFAMGDEPTCWPSNERLAEYVGVSVPTIKRAMASLVKQGHVHCESVRPTRQNMTGRLIHLRWREDRASDPYYLEPACFARPEPGEGGSPVSHPLDHQRATLRIMDEPPPGSPVSHNQDRNRKKSQESFSRIQDPIPLSPQRQRPEPKGESSEAGPPHSRASAGKAPQHRKPPAELEAAAALATPHAHAPLADSLSRARDNLLTLHSLAQEPVVSGAPSPFASPLPLSPGTERLTAEERTRLEDISPATRAHVLAWLAEDDPILLQEARKRLRPVLPPPPPPQTTVELLERIRESPHYPILAADLLAREFGDERSRRGFEARCRDAYEGHLAPTALIEAYRQATGPKTRNPGAIFMHALK